VTFLRRHGNLSWCESLVWIAITGIVAVLLMPPNQRAFPVKRQRVRCGASTMSAETDTDDHCGPQPEVLRYTQHETSCEGQTALREPAQEPSGDALRVSGPVLRTPERK